MERNSSKMTVYKYMHLLEYMTVESQKKLLKIVGKCLPKLRKISEPTEAAYKLIYCGKENGVEVKNISIFFKTICENLIICSFLSLQLVQLLDYEQFYSNS